MCAASNKHLCDCSLYRLKGKQNVSWAYAIIKEAVKTTHLKLQSRIESLQFIRVLLE